MFKHIVNYVFLSLFVVSAHATENSSPEIVGSLSSTNMEIMNNFQKENARGEWFTSIFSAADFCRSNRHRCTRLGYSSAKRQWYVFDYSPYGFLAY